MIIRILAPLTLLLTLGCVSSGTKPCCQPQHALSSSDNTQLNFSSSCGTSSDGAMRLEKVRFELNGNEACRITSLKLVLFDDVNHDGVLQPEEERGRIEGRPAVPSRFIEFGALQGRGTMGNAMLWTTVQTTQGEIKDSWKVCS